MPSQKLHQVDTNHSIEVVAPVQYRWSPNARSPGRIALRAVKESSNPSTYAYPAPAHTKGSQKLRQPWVTKVDVNSS